MYKARTLLLAHLPNHKEELLLLKVHPVLQITSGSALYVSAFPTAYQVPTKGKKDQSVFKKARYLFKKAPFLFLKGRYFFEKALALFRRCPRLFEGVSGALEHKPAKSDEELKMYSPTHFSRLNNLLLYRYSFLRC